MSVPQDEWGEPIYEKNSTTTSDEWGEPVYDNKPTQQTSPIVPKQETPTPFGIETSPTKIAENVVNPVKTFEFGQPQNVQMTQELQQFQSQKMQQALVRPQVFPAELPKTGTVTINTKEVRLPTDQELQTFVDKRDLPNIKKVAQDYKDIDPVKSAIMYEKVAEIEPDNAENHIQLAGQYAQIGNATKALESANVAQAIITNTPLTDEQKRNRTVAVYNPYLYQIKSWAQQKLGDYDGSIESGKASLNIASQKPTGEYLYQQDEKDYTDAATTASLITNAYNAKGDYENAKKYAQHTHNLKNVANAVIMAKSEKAYNDYFKSDDFQKDFLLYALSPEIHAAMGVYEGAKTMVESGAKAVQGEGVSKNALKSFNSTIGTMFSAAMFASPMVNYEFGVLGAIGENYAPEIYGAIMQPVSAFIEDKEKLSEVQKGVVETADVVGMLFLFRMFHKFNKGVQDGQSIMANKVLRADTELVKKVVTQQKLTDSEIKEVEKVIEETPDAVVDKAIEMAEKVGKKKQELNDKTIEENQKRLGLPKTPQTFISPETKSILDKMDAKEPVLNTDLDIASKNLYDEYKRLEAAKKSDTRQNTIEQIQSEQDKLGETIQILEEAKAKQKETGEFVGTEPISKTELVSTEPTEVVPEVVSETPAITPEKQGTPPVETLDQAAADLVSKYGEKPEVTPETVVEKPTKRVNKKPTVAEKETVSKTRTVEPVGENAPEMGQKQQKERKKIIREHLLDNEGDIDGAFKKAGYTNIDGFWIEPGAEKQFGQLSAETKTALKNNGVRFINNNLNKNIAGHPDSFNVSGMETVMGIGLADLGDNYSGHDMNVMHEIGHYRWGDLTKEQKDLFNDDNPITQHGKDIKNNNKGGNNAYTNKGMLGEEDFSQLFAENKGDLRKTIADKKRQIKTETVAPDTDVTTKPEMVEPVAEVSGEKVTAGKLNVGDKIFDNKKNQEATITKVRKPKKGEALENEPYVYDVKYDDGRKAINMPLNERFSVKNITEQPITIYKGTFGKKNPDGTIRSAHPNVKGTWGSTDKKVAERYTDETNRDIEEYELPAGTTIETVEVKNTKQSFEKIREQETELINNSKAQVVRLKTFDAKGREVQYIIKDEALLGKKQSTGKKIEPHPEVKVNQKSAVKDVVDGREDINESEGNLMYSNFNGKEIGETIEINGFDKKDNRTIQGKQYTKLVEKGYLEEFTSDEFGLTEKGKKLIDDVNTRLETRRGVKEGTDLFPEDANIPEFKAVKDKLKSQTDEGTIRKFEQRTADEVTKSEPTVKAIESKAKDAENLSKKELEKQIEQADDIIGQPAEITKEQLAYLNKSDKNEYFAALNKDGSGFQFYPVKGKPFENNFGLDLFISKNEFGEWHIIEGRSGVSVGIGKTQKLAAENWEAVIEKLKLDKDKIDEATVQTINKLKTGISPRYELKETKPVELSKTDIGKQKIAEGVDAIVTKMGGKKNFVPEQKTELIEDIKKIISGIADITVDQIRKLVDDISTRLKLSNDIKEDILKEVLPKEKEIELKHRATEEMREEMGLPEREKRKGKTDKELEANAEKLIKEGYNVKELADDILDGKKATDQEYVILTKYAAELEKKLSKTDIKSPEFDKILDEIQTVFRASETTGSETGAALGIRARFKTIQEETLSDFFVMERELNKDAPLTEQQKSTVMREYEEIKATNDALKKKIEQLEQVQRKQQAADEIKKMGSQARKYHKGYDFAKERQQIKQSISEKLKMHRSQMQSTIVPYASELIAIAPDVMKLARSYVAEGVVKLEDVISKLHKELKSEIPDIKENDVRDIIAGKYNETRKTHNEAARQMYDLKAEAKAIEKLERLQNGEVPKNETKLRRYNQEIEALRKQIREHDLTKLAEYKKRIQRQIDTIQKELDSGELKKPQKPKPIVYDKEAKELTHKYIKARMERDIRIMKEQYNNRSSYEKARDRIVEALNVPRTIMSSMDYSAPLRQGLIASISHPRIASKAFVEMFRQSFSQKRFDRWFYEVKDHPLYPVSKESKLYIADPHDVRLTAKEEMFMNNLAEKIPIIGKLIKGSERAYVGYLNKLRWDIFANMVDMYESQGKTFDNNPKLYKETAHYINNLTGRGRLGALENAAPIMSTFVFAPRLIASRINMLTNWANPSFYKNVPKEVRVQYFKDMGLFIGTGMTILALAKVAGADVEDDPRSSDFGKIKIGNSRWDIWGGHGQYIRLFTQLLLGESKSSTTGKITPLSGEGAFGQTRGDVLLRFVRGKLAPIPSLAADVLAGRTITGQKITLVGEAENRLMPLIYNDVKDAYGQGGITKLLGVGIPAMFGVGVQTYDSKDYVKSVMDKRKEPKKVIDEETKKQNKLDKVRGEENLKKQAEYYGIEYVPPRGSEKNKVTKTPSKNKGLKTKLNTGI